jgi:hypothetical protein
VLHAEVSPDSRRMVHSFVERARPDDRDHAAYTTICQPAPCSNACASAHCASCAAASPTPLDPNFNQRRAAIVPEGPHSDRSNRVSARILDCSLNHSGAPSAAVRSSDTNVLPSSLVNASPSAVASASSPTGPAHLGSSAAVLLARTSYQNTKPRPRICVTTSEDTTAARAATRKWHAQLTSLSHLADCVPS